MREEWCSHSRYYAAGASGTNLWLLRLRKQKLSDRSAGCFFVAIQWNSRDRPKNRLVENIARRRVLQSAATAPFLTASSRRNGFVRRVRTIMGIFGVVAVYVVGVNEEN